MEDQPKVPAGWTLTCAEVSNGVYHMRLTWEQGPVVETNGHDMATMRAWCIAAALDIEDQLRRKGMLA
jgi:hypothetical protein